MELKLNCRIVRNVGGLYPVAEGKMSTAAEHSLPDQNRLYIGQGVTIKGEIAVPDTLVVCGAIEGDISAGNLIIGETGTIKGRITVAENAEISGKVFEKLDVRGLLILRSTGRVDGNISYGLLQIEQGASIAGGLSAIDVRVEQKPAKTERYSKPDLRPAKQEPVVGNGSKHPGLSAVEPPNPAPNSSAP